MEQTDKGEAPAFWEKLLRKFSKKDPYKVNRERMESLMKGSLFGISGSDLFILLAALLALIFLQCGPRTVPFLEQPSQEIPAIETPSQIPPSAETPTATSEAKPKTGTESGKSVTTSKVICKSPRPEVCAQFCISGPPFICGSDGKSYCNPCLACAAPEVEWYLLQSKPCSQN